MNEPKDDPIVGHKTFRDGLSFRHEPLRQSEAEEIIAQFESNQARIEKLMPDEAAARRMLADAYNQMKKFGWTDIRQCPYKEGDPTFEVFELGSSGVHPAIIMGTSYWIQDDGDLWPSRPVLYREKKARS